MLSGPRGLVLAGVLILLAVYAFDAGHGFIKDDFQWILTSRIEHPGDLSGLLGAATGFFRPIVSLSFAADYALFGLAPLGYGLTNLALLFACVAGLAMLLRAFGVGRDSAILAAFVWALNFQGINTAVLWISGRTALLVTLACGLAAWAWLRQRRALGALLTLIAMWTKEEAFVVPAILTAWSLLGRERPLRGVRDTWPLWLAAIVSLAARSAAGAYTPGSAPALYRYEYDVATLGANGLAYADRISTTIAAALVIFWLAAGAPSLRQSLGDPQADREFRARLNKGVVWMLLSLTPTILLPVRSSLYALLPSVGTALICGTVADRIAAGASPRRVRRAVVVLVALFAILVPVYRIRNARFVNEAELSAAIVAELVKIQQTRPAGGLVVIKDTRDRRPTAEQALGPLGDRAAFLVTDGQLQLWIDPAPAELTGAAPPDLRSAVATLVVERGQVRRER